MVCCAFLPPPPNVILPKYKGLHAHRLSVAEWREQAARGSVFAKRRPMQLRSSRVESFVLLEPTDRACSSPLQELDGRIALLGQRDQDD